MACSSWIDTVFAPSTAAPACGARWSRSSDLQPVQSTTMSPGPTISSTSRTVRARVIRSTGSAPRAAMRSLSARSMVLSGQNPSVQSRSSAIRSGGIARRNAIPSSSSCGSNSASTFSPSIRSAR